MLCLWRKNNMEKKNLPYMKPHHTLVAGGFTLPIEVNLALATCCLIVPQQPCPHSHRQCTVWSCANLPAISYHEAQVNFLKTIQWGPMGKKKPSKITVTFIFNHIFSISDIWRSCAGHCFNWPDVWCT